MKLPSRPRLHAALRRLAVLFSAVAAFTIDAYAASGDPTDPNIVYVGRWDISNPSVYKSYYGGAYLMTIFTGNSVQLKLNATANVYVSIDHEAFAYYPAANGTVDLTPSPLASGPHHLRIAARSPTDVMQFTGLILGSGETTAKPLVAPIIEFVGDSITAGFGSSDYALTDFAWITGEMLGCEHTQVATPGIPLLDGIGGSTGNKGMESQFFKEKTVKHSPVYPWDFGRYQPKLVVIHLGTNDYGLGASPATFQSHYLTFIQNIRAVYPNAQICALRTFTGKMATETLAAANAAIAAGDTGVHFIDSTGWWTCPGDCLPDGHPTDAGHLKVAGYLSLALEPYLEMPPATTVDSTHLNYTKDLAMDGITYTQPSRWLSTNTTPPHIYRMDWPSPRTVSGVKIWSGAASGPGYQIKDFQIQYWNAAASTWQVVASLTNNLADGYVGGYNDIPFAPVTTDSLRLYITKPSQSDNFARLMELQVNPSPLADIILDDSDTVNVTEAGSWQFSNTSPGYVGTGYLHDGNSGSTGGKAVTFSPNISTSGYYDIYARWTTHPNRATNVPIDINAGSSSTTVVVNQQVNNATWILLGTFFLPAGTGNNVTVRNDGANGYVIADAIRLTYHQ